jgi:hypothetical protein
VKQCQIDDCLRLYRHAVDAYGELIGKLREVQAVAEGLPILRRTRRRLEEAMDDLDRMGAGLSVLPGLAEELAVERKLSALMRDQAARLGFVFRLEVEDGADPAGDLDDLDDEGWEGD